MPASGKIFNIGFLFAPFSAVRVYFSEEKLMACFYSKKARGCTFLRLKCNQRCHGTDMPLYATFDGLCLLKLQGAKSVLIYVLLF